MSEEETKTEMKERTRCEVYSRIVGYLRPVQQWNDGKRAEFFDRKTFNTILDFKG
jgi:ribonucleoside-triphosphate reductase